jgi:uncharacterized membrane protein
MGSKSGLAWFFGIVVWILVVALIAAIVFELAKNYSINTIIGWIVGILIVIIIIWLIVKAVSGCDKSSNTTDITLVDPIIVASDY